MKYEIVLIGMLVVASLALPSPQQDDSNAETLRLESENNGVDKYAFAYDTSNGITRTEEGELKTTEDGAAIVSHGSTSWTAPDGKRYEIVFTADETGYHSSFKILS